MTNQEFIQTIAPYCQKYAQKYGFKVASPAIAQACLESAYGTSNKAKHYNFFGLKYRPGRVSCNNGTFIDGSQEQNKDGSYAAITDQWYNFDNFDKGCRGYYEFLNIPNYAKVKDAGDPLTYLQEIKNAHYATSLDYVQNVYNVITKWNLTQYDNFNNNQINKGGTTMSNSSLVDCIIKSPNHSGKRTHSIDRITPHCVVGQLSATAIGNCFTNPSRQASCNYGIGTEGSVCLSVDEENRSWCSSSNANDQRAVTIECASDSKEPYAFNDKVYHKLIDLCTDICRRHGKKKLLWINNKDKALAYNPASDEMLLTVHRWFANKSCPGDWMYARMGDLANKVTARLGGQAAPSNPITTAAQSQTQTEKTNKNYPRAPFTVDVLVPDLNIRKTPNGQKTGRHTGKGKFTITQVDGDWGKLKSGLGWIYLANSSYVKINGSVQAAAAAPKTNNSFLVQVTANILNIRKGPGINYKINGTITDRGRYTIVEEKAGWGRLKSGAGWISLAYTKRV